VSTTKLTDPLTEVVTEAPASWRAWSPLEVAAGALGALLGLLSLLGMALAGTPAGWAYGPLVFLVLVNAAFLSNGLRTLSAGS